jgi:hypothetical protein
MRAICPKQPVAHDAHQRRQVWCWDVTHLSGDVIGHWFHLYLILISACRKIVGWEACQRQLQIMRVVHLRVTALVVVHALLTSLYCMETMVHHRLSATTVLPMLGMVGKAVVPHAPLGE